MRRLFSFFSILVLCVSYAYAVQGIGRPVQIIQKDGSRLTIIVRGDEYYRLTTTVDGYQLMQRDGIYYYYDESLSKSPNELIRASDPADRSIAQRLALVGRRPGRVDGLVPSAAQRMSYPKAAALIAALASGQEQPQSRATSNKLPTQVLVILVQFSDLRFNPEHTQQQFNALLNEGSLSAKAYFSDNSMAQYVPNFVVSPVVTLDHNYAYYGQNVTTSGHSTDARAPEMVAQACRAAQAAGINFAQFDCNKDGVVDNVSIIFAGDNEAEGGSTDKIWPHSWQLYNANALTLDGVKLSLYSCTSELKGTGTRATLMTIGTYCHEFCHVLGLQDLYDTNYEDDGASVGLYNISIMSSGNYNDNGKRPPHLNALERYILGWNTPATILPDTSPTLLPVQTDKNSYFIRSLADKSEFYMMESRQAIGWDAPLKNLNGMLIYHIDASNNDSGSGVKAIDRWQKNTINCNVEHPCMRLIESTGKATSNYKDAHQHIVYPGSRNITSFTASSYGGIDWRGNPVQVDLKNISWVNGTTTFATSHTKGTGKTLTFIPSQRSIKVNIAIENLEQKYRVIYKESSSTIESKIEVPQGENTITITGLTPNTSYDISLAEVDGQTETAIFKDKAITLPLNAPYCAMKGVKGSFKVGETLPLEVVNVAKATRSISFFLDGNLIAGQSYVLNSEGTFRLTCTIIYAEDGEQETLRRIITVSAR